MNCHVNLSATRLWEWRGSLVGDAFGHAEISNHSFTVATIHCKDTFSGMRAGSLTQPVSVLNPELAAAEKYSGQAQLLLSRHLSGLDTTDSWSWVSTGQTSPEESKTHMQGRPSL